MGRGLPPAERGVHTRRPGESPQRHGQYHPREAGGVSLETLGLHRVRRGGPLRHRPAPICALQEGETEIGGGELVTGHWSFLFVFHIWESTTSDLFRGGVFSCSLLVLRVIFCIFAVDIYRIIHQILKRIELDYTF